MAETARPSSLVASDVAKFVLAWAAFLALVIVCFGLAGVTSGAGFAAGAAAASIGIAVTASFVAALAYLGELIDRRLKLDAAFRCIGGLLGLLCAAFYGIYLYNQFTPVVALGGP